VELAPRIRSFGERALLVELGESFDEALVTRSRAIADDWESRGLGPAVPAYASVLLRFDPRRITPSEAERQARDAIAKSPPLRPASSSRLIEIPTVYDGPDLKETAALSKLSVGELVGLHADREYTAYFLGFLPGWAYCGRLDPRIVAPRLLRPRERVPAGSVGIADGQTGVYPLSSPGGWRLIARTEVVLFDPSAAEPTRIRAGDRVRFVRR
jgi:KipI family sensor histidine kinase inhibitor